MGAGLNRRLLGRILVFAAKTQSVRTRVHLAPRILLVAVAAVALLLLAGVAYLVGHHASLPAPGSEKYEQYVEAFDVGIAALDADVPQIAQESLTKAIDLVPSEPAAWADRGLLLIRDGRLDEALADLHKAERLAPDNAAIQQLLGIAEQRRGQLAAAAEHFRNGDQARAEERDGALPARRRRRPAASTR